MSVSYALAVFAGATLLFLVQPLVGKALLPWFGGSPAVWTTCLVFFQVALLAGYGYAHLSAVWLSRRGQGRLHAGLLLLAAVTQGLLPDPARRPAGDADPTLAVLSLLLRCAGPPYLLLAASGPLLQAWWTREREGIPYRLYALSNAGSLLALLAYPLLLEPTLTLPGQARGWQGAFLGFALGTAALALRGGELAPPEAPRPAAAPEVPWSHRLAWLALPACACALLLGVTSLLTSAAAVVPFLWVAPLATYLLTFVLAFERDAWYPRGLVLPALALALPALAALYAHVSGIALESPLPPFLGLGGALLALFVACLACHGELARLRPHPRLLTGYYLTISAGGALGGLLAGAVAPRLALTYLEVPLALVACAALVPLAWRLDPRGVWAGWAPPRRRVALALTGLVVTVFALVLARGEGQLRTSSLELRRSFFGALRVLELPAGPGLRARFLLHGRVCHGVELLGGRTAAPLAYYGRESGIGRTLTALGPRGPLRVGLVGLGIGSLAAYARPGDAYRFFEVDPEVIHLAESRFSFVPDHRDQVEVLRGDGRLALEGEPPASLDALVLDAFSGDAIPVHLLTREAFRTYARALASGGVLAVHLSNDASPFDLEPLVRAQVEALGLRSLLLVHPGDRTRLIYPSRWLVATRDPDLLQAPALAALRVQPERPPARPWTDDWCDLLGVLR